MIFLDLLMHFCCFLIDLGLMSVRFFFILLFICLLLVLLVLLMLLVMLVLLMLLVLLVLLMLLVLLLLVLFFLLFVLLVLLMLLVFFVLVVVLGLTSGFSQGVVVGRLELIPLVSCSTTQGTVAGLARRAVGTYIYIYIYVCVRMYVCAELSHFGNNSGSLRTSL